MNIVIVKSTPRVTSSSRSWRALFCVSGGRPAGSQVSDRMSWIFDNDIQSAFRATGQRSAERA